MKIAFVGCTKVKEDYRCQAQEMYMPSTLFRLGTEHIKTLNFDAWCILSAEYGLLFPAETINPYDKTLNNFSKIELKEWADDVFLNIPTNITEAHFYTGVNYSSNLIEILNKNGVKCYEPLKGLGIGQRLAYFKNGGVTK